MNAGDVRKDCSNLYPIDDIRSISIENKETIGEYYKCVFEGNNQHQQYAEEDEFIGTAIELFPYSSNGDLYSCLEENGDLNQQDPKFYFNFVNCLVREVVDGTEQYCLYRNEDAFAYFECIQEQSSSNNAAVSSEFKEQSVEYTYRVAETTYGACHAARSSKTFVSCIRQGSQDKSKSAQKECDIDLSQYDLKTVADEEQKKVIGNEYKCVLNKLNTKQLPIVYPSLELFYKKAIQTITNCQRRNSYADDWSFYFKFAKCVEA